MKRGDFLSLHDLTSEQIQVLVDRAAWLKAHRRPASWLCGQSLALVFQKPSLRTRGSFDVAMYELGGQAVYFSPEEIGLGKREPTEDVARVLSHYVHAIAARTFRHRDIEVLAKTATIPVINALSDYCHPCQGLADLLTLKERFGTVAGVRLCYVGDGNNVARTLAFASARVGLHLRVASPSGYTLEPDLVAETDREARLAGGSVTLVTDPRDAAEGADAVYTDVWTSMGQEAESVRRRLDFAGYCVDQSLLRLARPDAIVMHDLPAHRGEEITDDVMDGPQSVVFEQAGNRLHAQKAVLLWLMESEPEGGGGGTVAG